MKQLCPACMKSVEVPETAAGTDYPCPVCGSMIPVPANYTPSVASPPPPTPVAPPPPPADRPPPPPGLAPPPGTLTTAPPAPPMDPSDFKEWGVTLSPRLLEWLPAISLSLVFILTFFSWIGSYPGGHRLFTQNAWEALAGDHTPNSVPAELEDVEKKLETPIMRYSWFVLPFVIALVIAIFFAWADRFLPDTVTPTSLPGPLVWLTKVWPLRHGILLVLSALLLILFVLLYFKGLSLENALAEYATMQHEELTKAADTDLKKTAARVITGQEYAKFAVKTTSWYALTFWLLLIGLLSLIIHRRLEDKPGHPGLRFSIRA